MADYPVLVVINPVKRPQTNTGVSTSLLLPGPLKQDTNKKLHLKWKMSRCLFQKLALEVFSKLSEMGSVGGLFSSPEHNQLEAPQHVLLG